MLTCHYQAGRIRSRCFSTYQGLQPGLGCVSNRPGERRPQRNVYESEVSVAVEVAGSETEMGVTKTTTEEAWAAKRPVKVENAAI